MWRCALPCVLLPSLAAQFYTTDAGVQSPDLPSLRERIEWRSRRDAEQWIAETRLVWSPRRELELDLTVPLVARHLDGVGGRSAQQGLGDVVTSGKLALVRDDGVMQSDRLSLLLDVSLPTGDDDGTVDGLDLGPRAALGLGTAGVGAGIGGTIVRDRHRAAAAVRWWQFARDGGFEPGPMLALDVAWWYRLTPAVFAPHGDEVELRLVVEALARWVADDRRGGNDVGNGGHELRLVVGLQANLTPSFALELGAVLPLTETTSSPFGDERLGGLFSCRMSF
ncbi:MAG: hypothetical protein JNM25_10620 [Planctomycetes bacterium]|nr:hypothetical protein [Planctomycetota bacterium]